VRSPLQNVSRLVGDHYNSDPVPAGLSAVIRSLVPGDRLPGERELAATLRVSRSALRDRLRLVEGLGVLRRTTGSAPSYSTLIPPGWRSPSTSPLLTSLIPLSALHSVRTAIERQAAIEAAQQAGPRVDGLYA